MLPLCAREDNGVIPWRPLVKGFITRHHDVLYAIDRGDPDRYLRDRPYDARANEEINERVEELAYDTMRRWHRSR